MKFKFLAALFASLVCLGFAVMFGANTADAQQVDRVEVHGLQLGTPVKDFNDTRTLLVVVRDSAGGPLANISVQFTSKSAEFAEVAGGTYMATLTKSTGVAGSVVVDVKPTSLNAQITIDMELTDTESPPNKATFSYPINVVGPPIPQITVNRPSPETGLAVGSTFTQAIEINDATDLAAWSIDAAFNPNVLEVVKITEGDFLEGGGLDAFFYDNPSGTISLSQTRIDRTYDATTGDAVLAPLGKDGGSDGDGTLVTIEFKLKEFAEEALGLHNVSLSNSAGARVSYSLLVYPVVATDMFPDEDVNRDGIVNVLDLTVVAQSLGEANPTNPRADVNDDGIVNALDLVTVAKNLGNSTPATKVRNPNAVSAPAADVANLSPETIQGWIDIAQVEDDGSAIFDLGIANLERLLADTVPSQTKLLLNYPNPFNPETWIPYQLATATDVSVSIYSVNGTLVRTLALGHQAAGVYQSKSQAAYWDGRNELGEQVASGVYFYTLTAGDFSATGKMLVRK